MIQSTGSSKNGDTLLLIYSRDGVVPKCNVIRNRQGALAIFLQIEGDPEIDRAKKSAM